MEKIDYIQLVSLLKDFNRVDRKKVLHTIDEQEHRYWSNLHISIMDNLYNKPYSHLLDRRNFIRVAVSVPMDYYKLNERGFRSSTIDLGINGICLPLNRDISINEKIICQITRGGFMSKKMNIDSTLCWKKPRLKAMGFCFNTLSAKETEYMLDLVHSSLDKRLEEIA